MATPLVLQMARRFKRALIANEQGTIQRMAREWTKVEDRLRDGIELVARDMADARRDGREPTPTMLWEMQRYRELLVQLDMELSGYVPIASQATMAIQKEGIDLGLQHARQTIDASFMGAGMIAPSFNHLPASAVENMVGFLANGSPLDNLLRRSYGPAADAMGKALIDGTAMGWNPRKTAKLAREKMTGGSFGNMLTITRTEQLRAFREADRRQMDRSGVVEYYVRLVAHSGRTCVACLAAEGERYTTRESLRDHPNGRCTALAKVSGIPLPKFEGGEAWFGRQSPKMQRQIMGSGRYDAWHSGKAGFKDMSVRVANPIWGDSVKPASLADLGIAA